MTEEEGELRLRSNVVIEFKRSSTARPGGTDGYRVLVTELAKEGDIDIAFEQAKRARRACLAELGEIVISEERYDELLARARGEGQGGSECLTRRR